MTFWMRIDGYPATEIAAHTPPVYEHVADGGCWSASWAFSLSMRSQHQALRVGALVEILCGSMPVWSGLMSEPDRTTWECTAYGLAAQGHKYLGLDSGGATTRNFGVAIAQAIARSWQVANPFSVIGTAAGDATGNPVAVMKLLEDYAEQTGQRTGVDAQRRVYMRPDPTTPRWLASPDSSAFGTTDEDRAGTLFGRYLDSTSGVYATATSGSGTPEVDVDLSDRGAMSLVAAQAILAGMLTRDNAQTAWTNGATLTRDQLQTMGGTPAFMPAVLPGQMMRSFGLSYASQAVRLDTVIGKTRLDTGALDRIYVEPINTALRNARAVWAA